MYQSMQQARRLPVVRPCRLIARRRFPAPVSARRFHLSRQWLSSPSSDGPTPTPSDIVDGRDSSYLENATNHGSSPIAKSEKTTGRPVPRPYGSAVRRAMRNRQSEQQQHESSQTASIPAWFQGNVTTYGPQPDVLVQSQCQVEITKSGASPDSEKSVVDDQTFGGGGGGEDPSAPATPSKPENRYIVAEALWEELRASAKAGLQLPPPQYAKEPPAKKSHLVLQYPGHDGILFLDAIVKRLAHDIHADLITLNAQDIAQLFSENDLAESGATSAIRSLGYEVHRPAVMAAFAESGEGEGDADEDIPEIAGTHPGARAEISTPRFITIEASREPGDVPIPNWLGLKSLVASINGQPDNEPGTSRGAGQRMEQRWTGLLNEILHSASGTGHPGPRKVDPENESPKVPESVIEKPLLRDTIIHIQDYREIQSSREGSRVIHLLQKVIQERRRAGSKILLIGSTSQELQHTNSRDGPKILQNVFDDQFSKTLVITPSMDVKAVDKIFAEDHQKRTMDINIRHLQTMLRYRLNDSSSIVNDDIFGSRDWPLDPSTIKKSGFRERFWSYNQVHWVSTLALGSAEPDEPFSFEHIRRGIELMDGGDRVTSDWLQEKAPKSSESSGGQSREQLLKSLRQTCTAHEKKLLNGVVDAQSIRTTFADVHVMPETVDALKTLTSLSLIRPEAFTYGVLATDKIPGLLLYGPPGTGKTLLAKAVARESGATVLEVSGSEVYDMYVGEGEKNVKAIFTLAKKLSPCVVFIDEADAIFCSRTGASSRTSHRELINQFLREWDGMNDMSAFIMVATNRPFDLDDAVLRRLPRRLLVDLPTEQDRHAILKIHLKDEQLDSSVDLADLAHRTPLYSGSDLKNLSVAAALACVREENRTAAEHNNVNGNEPYQYPERRTLTRAHFELGMEEISASINEDMSSLSAIRKFDEQYGDRKAQRKKSSGWGFIPAGSEGSREDAARVRT
ncbi:hypothetical protein N7532_008429 [Penicillium argentinense]|uniref:AAA+ ATPase domain-containing protein n=1 Tax=Penicillium argentinense TaxID=1131581 RepID=A0A9W9K1W1_9EURO|nr:uncharacterized protein N7532_008429 [Penicillium argentinense]KAJ5089745.1 hypothetical protein N7532_008429 [Penicillium argentinense]